MTIRSGEQILASDMYPATDHIPKPVALIRGSSLSAYEEVNINTNTDLWAALVNIPIGLSQITKIRFYATPNTNGQVKVALFSQSGATKIFEGTSSTISVGGIITITVTAVDIPAGNYWLCILPVGTADIIIQSYYFEDTDISDEIYNEQSPSLGGGLTVTASTIPSTITPTSITYHPKKCFICRLMQ